MLVTEDKSRSLLLSKFGIEQAKRQYNCIEDYSFLRDCNYGDCFHESII